jgi:hypothetical protein
MPLAIRVGVTLAGALLQAATAKTTSKPMAILMILPPISEVAYSLRAIALPNRDGQDHCAQCQQIQNANLQKQIKPKSHFARSKEKAPGGAEIGGSEIVAVGHPPPGRAQVWPAPADSQIG